MSRRRRARPMVRQAPRGAQSTAHLLPSIEVHGQALPPDLAEPLAHVTSLLRAKVSEAERLGGSAAEADLGAVYTLLAQTPKLTEWLNTGQRFQAERARAIAEARGERLPEPSVTKQAGAAWAGGATWLDTKASPTGRVTGVGSRWTNNDSETYKDTADAVPSPGWLRKWAESSVWVRNAINCRRVQIGRSFVACVPKNVLKPYNKGLMKRVNHLLQQPNEARQNWRELMEMVIEDLLVLDRGCISKAMTVGREPVALYAEDGATIRIYPGWSGDLKEPRYLYVSQDNRMRIPLRNDQLICMMDNPATHRMGLSPVQVLADIIEADLQAVSTRSRMVAQKPPPLILQLPGEQRNQIRAIATDYEANIGGQKEVLFLGGEQAMNALKLVNSSRDDQLMEWQEYICRLIAITFKLAPSQFGAPVHATEGDASANVQMFEDTGLLPLLMLIEDYLNREFLADFAPKLDMNREDLDALNLEIKFPQVGEQMRQMHAEKAAELAAQGLLQLPSFTLNQILAMRGEELVPGGNTFYVNSSMGPVPWLSYDGADPSMNPLLAMTALAMDGDADQNAGKPKVTPPKPGGAGQAGGSDNSRGTGHDNPPPKPAGAPKPGGAAVQKPQTSPQAKPGGTPRPKPKKSLAQEQREADIRRLVDGRTAGKPWQPGVVMLQRALDLLSDEDIQLTSDTFDEYDIEETSDDE